MNAKLTRNQRQVYEALKAAKQELTAQDLHQQLRGATQRLGLYSERFIIGLFSGRFERGTIYKYLPLPSILIHDPD